MPDDTRTRAGPRRVHLFRDAVFEAEGLTSMERLLLLSMSRHCDWDTGADCRPGMERLMRETSMSRRSVQRTRETLVDKGWLRLVSTGSTKGGPRASVYELAFDQRQSDASGVVHKRQGDASDQRHCGASADPTGATLPTTSVREAHDQRQSGTPSLTDHVGPRVACIAEEHKAVASVGLGALKSIIRGEAS